MINLKYSFILLFACLFSNLALAQDDDKKDPIPIGTFKLSLIAGLNAAQINGDDIAGYNKVGLEAGGEISYRIKESWMPSVSILYSQKGSRSEPRLDGYLTHYRLNYVSIPVMMHYLDGGIRISGGLSYNRLLSSDFLQRDFDETTERAPYYRNTDINVILGFGYFTSNHWGFDLRWSNSTFSIVDIDFGNIINEPQINRVLTFRTLYQF